jgi:O-methyltransferase involved in polyketide biosynthesis
MINMGHENKLGILGSVQETLLLPLWGRAMETQKEHPKLVDKTAVSILSKIGYDFTTIARNISELSQMAWVARSIFFDNEIKEFIEKHPRGTVVNIGCGLDTTYERIDNGTLEWFDLDLPDVIQLRKQYIAESERRHFLAYSVFNRSWFDQIIHKNQCLFLIAGVLYYFTEEEIKGLFQDFISTFPRLEIVFDYASLIGVRVANKKVIKNGGMDESAYLKWGVKDLKSLSQWDSRIKILSDIPMFQDYKKQLDFRRRIATAFSDHLKIMSLAHIRME